MAAVITLEEISTVPLSRRAKGMKKKKNLEKLKNCLSKVFVGVSAFIQVS